MQSRAASEIALEQYAGALANQRTSAGRGTFGRRATLVTLGLAGILFGGLPYWAARKVLYPPVPEPLPHGLDEALTIDPDIAAEPARFMGRDGSPISAWFVPGAPGVERSPCILLVYGYGGYKEQMVGYAGMLRDAGFACLMFDMQGSGLLSGRPVTLGHKERWDLMDAVAYARSRADIDPTRIGVLGVSMGAATALLAAEHDPSIRALAADSAYASLPDMITPGLRAFVGRTAALFAPLIVWFGETMLGIKSSDIAPERSAARMGSRHLLVIHGEKDDLTHPDSASRIFEAAAGPKELWVVPECGHSAGPQVSPLEYKQRVNAFFRLALDWPPGAESTQVA